jgi:acetoin utilization deacetylase AcuC-like enzyme
MTVAYFTHPSSTQHEMGSHHPECPDRVRVINDHLRANGLLDFMREETAPVATREVILRAHGAGLLDELEEISPQQG